MAAALATQYTIRLIKFCGSKILSSRYRNSELELVAVSYSPCGAQSSWIAIGAEENDPLSNEAVDLN